MSCSTSQIYNGSTTNDSTLDQKNSTLYGASFPLNDSDYNLKTQATFTSIMIERWNIDIKRTLEEVDLKDMNDQRICPLNGYMIHNYA